MVNVPLLRERGELRGALGPRNLQAAWAPADHVGVMANGYTRSDDHTTDGGERQVGEGFLLEVGGGAFTTLADPKWLQLEVYAGAGVGHVKHEITPAGQMTRRFEADGFRVFLQPSAGFTSDYFDAAVSLRVVSVSYSDVETENYSPEQLMGDRFAGIEDTTWVFLEPAVTVRAGYKWIKLQLQAGKSLELSSPELNYDNGMMSAALTVDLFRAFSP